MDTLMPRLTSQTFAGQGVKYPMIMPLGKTLVSDLELARFSGS